MFVSSLLTMREAGGCSATCTDQAGAAQKSTHCSQTLRAAHTHTQFIHNNLTYLFFFFVFFNELRTEGDTNKDHNTIMTATPGEFQKTKFHLYFNDEIQKQHLTMLLFTD